VPFTLEGALIAIVTLTRGYPRAPFGWSGTLGTVPMIADGSLLRSEGETWGPVSPDNVHETGVSPGGQSRSLIVAAEAQQVEPTRTKTWSRARSEVFVPYRHHHGDHHVVAYVLAGTIYIDPGSMKEWRPRWEISCRSNPEPCTVSAIVVESSRRSASTSGPGLAAWTWTAPGKQTAKSRRRRRCSFHRSPRRSAARPSWRP
jgi:hypothetical protein